MESQQFPYLGSLGHTFDGKEQTTRGWAWADISDQMFHNMLAQ